MYYATIKTIYTNLSVCKYVYIYLSGVYGSVGQPKASKTVIYIYDFNKLIYIYIYIFKSLVCTIIIIMSNFPSDL